VHSTGDLQTPDNPTQLHELPLYAIHRELRVFVDALLSDFPNGGEVSTYFVRRGQYKQAVKQDLLPLLVYLAIGNQEHSKAMPLAAAWALYLAASHLLDDAQDSGHFQAVNHGVMALGLANVALAQLEVNEDGLRDILDAVGRVAALGANAQSSELERENIPSRTDYFRNIIGKAASIIATGVWIGGRLATDETETLSLLKEFGLALGMIIQISDDCLDLAEDLTDGIYTLPVIEGLLMTAHPEYPELKCLVDQKPLQSSVAKEVVDLLDEMGALTVSRRMVRAYQAQAAAVFESLPGLATYFSDYVAPDA
jgi:geranylgeranyl pyrophosphate synthase